MRFLTDSGAGRAQGGLRELGKRGGRVLLAALLCGLVIPAAGQAYSPPPIRHVFVLTDENQSASTVFQPGSAAPYLSQTLTAQGAYLPNFYGIGHDSLDNYIAMVSGQAPNPLTQADCLDFVDFPPAASMDASGQQTGQGCVYPSGVPTLMSQFDAAGLTWRAYEDGMGADPTREAATCAHPAVGTHDPTQAATSQDQYVNHHNPFVYFHSVIDNQAACNANVVGLGQLPSDLQSVSTTPNYVFITPNECNNSHQTPCPNGQPGGLAQADSFLKTWVPLITSSPAFQRNGLLIIVFDEAASGVGGASACCNEAPGPSAASPGGYGPGGGNVGAVLLSPAIAPGTTSSTSYNHYSMLASVEDLFGLPRIADAVGANAFGLDVYTRPNGVSGATGGTGGPGGAGRLSAGRLHATLWREITPSGRAARIASLIKARSFFLPFLAPEAGRVLVRWYAAPRLGKARRGRASPVLIASGQVVFLSRGRRMIKLKLTRAGERVLKRTKQLNLTLTAKGTFIRRGGTTVSARKAFVLKP